MTFTNPTVQHKLGERRARPIKGREREELRVRLATEKPSRLRNAKLAQLTPEQFIAGNRDGSGATAHVYTKISAESKSALQLDSNVVISVMKIREKIIDDASNLYKLLPNAVVPGYIQQIIAFPFASICFTEAGVRLYHSVVAKQPLYCDATGTIVASKTQSGLFKWDMKTNRLFTMLWLWVIWRQKSLPLQ